jgi:hypothetical protein
MMDVMDHQILAMTVFVFVVCTLMAYLRIPHKPPDDVISPPSTITTVGVA